jgi:hypothetical protein
MLRANQSKMNNGLTTIRRALRQLLAHAECQESSLQTASREGEETIKFQFRKVASCVSREASET